MTTSPPDSISISLAARTSSPLRVDSRATSSVCRDRASATTEIGPSAMADSDSDERSATVSAEMPTTPTASTDSEAVTTLVAPWTNMSTSSPAFIVKSVVVTVVDSRANTSRVSPTRTVAEFAFACRVSEPSATVGARMAALRPALMSTDACELSPRDASEKVRKVMRRLLHSRYVGSPGG